jgi:hypothetical protein
MLPSNKEAQATCSSTSISQGRAIEWLTMPAAYGNWTTLTLLLILALIIHRQNPGKCSTPLAGRAFQLDLLALPGEQAEGITKK